MPGGDRTGPWGLGPRTGRGLGFCSGYGAPGYLYPGPGMGFGRGFGRGFGLGRGFGRGMGFSRGRGFWRRGFGGLAGFPMPAFAGPYVAPGAAEAIPEKELDFLKSEAQYIRDELAAIEARMQELQKEAE